jgi:hypothetical protein
MNLDTNTIEKQWQEHQNPSLQVPRSLEAEESTKKVQEIKQLLLKFKTSHKIREGSPDYHQFQRLL